MLFWIPVNKAMFTGDDDYAATHELAPVARSAARAFMSAYGVGREECAEQSQSDGLKTRWILNLLAQSGTASDRLDLGTVAAMPPLLPTDSDTAWIVLGAKTFFLLAHRQLPIVRVAHEEVLWRSSPGQNEDMSTYVLIHGAGSSRGCGTW